MLESTGPLVEHHDLVMLDLDGVVYVSGEAVPGAPEHLADVRDAGVHLAFVTNNASRPPELVAEGLTGMGVPADPSDVVTSAQAAARMAVDTHGEGAPVLLLGGDGLHAAAGAAGLRAVGLDEEPVALMTGYGPDVLWSDIMSAAVAVADGLPWIASNTDHTIPTAAGRAPGHGVLVDMLARFTGVSPDVAGKPSPPLLTETIRRVGGERPLMVGDRLDTDIAGARAVDLPSLLVMTGVTGLEELARAGVDERPTYVAVDLGGLLEDHRAAEVPDGSADGGVTCGGWSARVADGRLEVTGDGEASDWWRAAARASWDHLDATGGPAVTDGCTPPTTR